MATANQGASAPEPNQPADAPSAEGRAGDEADAGAATEMRTSGDDKAPAALGDAAPAGDEKEAPEPPSGDVLEKEVEAQRRLAEERHEAFLRTRAELENLRKRSVRELEKAHKYALEAFMGELLPVKDSMELGLSAAAEKGTDVGHLREGLALTLKMFEQAVQKFGLTEIDPLGEVFNPEFHQAMTMQESAEAEAGTVITVVQKGYLLNQRLVRPAMVIVAK